MSHPLPVLFALRLLGGFREALTLGEGTQRTTLGPGVWELQSYNGWTYYRPGMSNISLDAVSLPVDAAICAPGVSQYLYVEKQEEWSFRVSEGSAAVLVQRVVKDEVEPWAG